MTDKLAEFHRLLVEGLEAFAEGHRPAVAEVQDYVPRGDDFPGPTPALLIGGRYAAFEFMDEHLTANDPRYRRRQAVRIEVLSVGVNVSSHDPDAHWVSDGKNPYSLVMDLLCHMIKEKYWPLYKRYHREYYELEKR
jgi:hypothetical protein